MRIFHLISTNGVYGAERALLNLLPSLQNLGAEVSLGCLCTFDSAGLELGEELQQLGIPVIFINNNRKFDFGVLWAIYSAMKQTRADVLHVHGYKATILGGLVANLMQIPLISTYHGEAKTRTELSTYLKIETYFIRRAFRIIAVSAPIRKELITRGVSKQKISVIYNGIADPLKIHRKISSSHGSHFSPHILSVGRLIQMKRYDLIIDTMKLLKTEFPNIGLSIAGNGPLEARLKEYTSKSGLDSHVKFLGYVKDTTQLYNTADIFVLSSNTEGSPIVLLEAMAASLPIITTSVGAIPEIVRNRKEAIIIPPNNLQILAHSVRHLILRPNYSKELGYAARQHFLRHYTAEIMAKSYLQNYKMIPNN